jgi:uncharacterized membrane protein
MCRLTIEENMIESMTSHRTSTPEIPMAQKMTVTMTDDLDGSVAKETVRFAIDGTSYELDLNDKNAAALRKTFERYVAAARRASRASVASSKRGRRSAPSRGNGVDAAAVRAWATSNKISVSTRGRIPASLVEQYVAAGN